MSFSEKLLKEVDGFNISKIKRPTIYLGKCNPSIDFDDDEIIVTLKNGAVMTFEDFEEFCYDMLYEGYQAQDGKIYSVNVPQLAVNDKIKSTNPVKNTKWSGKFEIIEEI